MGDLQVPLSAPGSKGGHIRPSLHRQKRLHKIIVNELRWAIELNDGAGGRKIGSNGWSRAATWHEEQMRVAKWWPCSTSSTASCAQAEPPATPRATSKADATRSVMKSASIHAISRLSQMHSLISVNFFPPDHTGGGCGRLRGRRCARWPCRYRTVENLRAMAGRFMAGLSGLGSRRCRESIRSFP